MGHFNIELKIKKASATILLTNRRDQLVLTSEQYLILKRQIGTSKPGSGGKQKKPLVFTENGVAMLSSVLRSPQAIQVNVSIMRIFTRLRSYHLIGQDLKHLKSETNRMFRVVFERLDSIEETIEPKLSPRRKKIGLK